MAEIKRIRDIVKRASSQDIELLKERLGILPEDDTNILGAIRRGRNLEHKKQPLIEFHETVPSAKSYPEGFIIISPIVGSETNVLSFYMVRDKEWNHVGAYYSESSAAGATRRGGGNDRYRFGLQGGGSSAIPSRSTLPSPFYDSGWFAVVNNTTYTSGTSTGFGTYNHLKNPSAVNMFFSTANTGVLAYPVVWDSVNAGVGIKVESTALSVRTGVVNITKYWDGSAFQAATSGYLRIHIA